MTARQLYTHIRRQLAQNNVTAPIESAVLFELATGQRYPETNPEQVLSETAIANARALVSRRLDGEPLQYLAGRWPFLDFELAVGPGVLIPRPETETAALAAIEALQAREQPAALDLCAGSGCIAIAMARAIPNGRVTAVEREAAALAYLKRNAADLAPHIEIIQADIFGWERQANEHAFDVIVSNPPYVTPAEYAENLDELRHEPTAAFLGGDDGLDFYRHITAHYKSKLKSGGWLIFEIGFNQEQAVTALLEREGYGDIEVRHDDFGLPRVAAGRQRGCP